MTTDINMLKEQLKEVDKHLSHGMFYTTTYGYTLKNLKVFLTKRIAEEIKEIKC